MSAEQQTQVEQRAAPASSDAVGQPCRVQCRAWRGFARADAGTRTPDPFITRSKQLVVPAGQITTSAATVGLLAGIRRPPAWPPMTAEASITLPRRAQLAHVDVSGRETRVP